MMDVLIHYGTKYHSGRYPYGSGENPYQHESDFLKSVRELKEKGLTEVEIANALKLSTTELRERKTIEKEKQRAADLAEIIRLKDKGWSQTAIAERIGRNESYVRYLYDPVIQERTKITESVADALAKRVNEDRYIDIGEGSQLMVGLNGVSKTKMNAAIRKLKDEGYKVHYIKVQQAGVPGKYTTLKVLTKDDVPYSEVASNKDKIALVDGKYYTNDGGRSFLGIEDPASVSADRVKIRYAEDGGKDKDGVIEIRRNVEDLSLGKSNYAQVRIAVGGTHYLKGMAVYSDGDDMPPGVDIIFNTNKHNNVPKMSDDKNNSVLKPLKDDPDNPFGSLIKIKDGAVVGQSHYISKDGKDKLSAINIVNEEGDWDNWSKTLASQFLSKQPKELIKQQLDLSYSRTENEFKKIEVLTNPEIKKILLNEFADECDAKAVHLKAAALPRQASKVILPLTSIKEDEVYAPTFRHGEKVILVRYPHAGTFEIPVLTVNKNVKEGNRVIGKDAPDAIGINSKVAARLSGADFDGDTVLVIPMAGQKLNATSPLKGLADFDPKESYPGYKGMKVMNNTQIEMGKITNLITDMTLKGAPESEIAKAVRHSMVVIDAEKHELNYKQSYIDNEIASLKKKYQGSEDAGASTLISKAKSAKYVNARKELYPDPETGERRYKYTNETYHKPIKDKETGKIIGYEEKETPRLLKSTQMMEAKDAFELSSGHVKEAEYARYANKLKALANQARKEALSIKPSVYSPAAKKVYSEEVASLNSKLNIALKNKPLERQAQAIADTIVKAKKADNPSMSSEEIKKIKTQAITEARTRTGANKKATSVKITDREWEAIQAGAISSSKLYSILQNTDRNKIKEYATPLEFRSPSKTDQARIKMLYERGYNLAEIADDIGFSTSTVYSILNPDQEIKE